MTLRLLLSASLLVCLVPAQSPDRATVSGVITDAQGAVVVGAEVTALNTQTGTKYPVKSNESGFYVIRLLPIGDYVISAEMQGFRRFERHGITLTTGQTLGLDIQLEVGALTEAINVTASASGLETRTSEVSVLVESKTMENMALGDRRTMNILRFAPAVVFVNYDSGAKPNFSMAGGRTQSQMFWIDGGTGQNMRLGVGQVDTDPPVEVVQEIKVLTNNYAAEYGGSAGGVIVATTKSGTNQFKGSLFEYLRNDKLDAANFFAPVSGDKKVKAPLRYNVFGGTVGGPIRRDKAFFFFGYEGSRRHEGATSTLTVPTAEQKAGDYSQTVDARGALVPIYDPATTRQEGARYVRTQFPGNRIPANRLDPVAVKLTGFYPAPNKAPDNPTGANNYRANSVDTLTRNNFTVKVDYNLGDNDKLNARYLYNSDDTGGTSVWPEAGADTTNNTKRHQQFWYGSWTRVFSSALVNEFRFTYGNRINHAYSRGLGGNWPSKIGIKGVPDDAFPQIAATGFATFGSANQERRQFPIEQYQIVDNVSWVRARHALKLGVELRPSYNYEINRPAASGTFGFSTLPTGLPGTAASGNGLASMLLGFVTGFTARQTELLDRSSWYLAGFVQDDWTVSRNLTFNLGVRFETDTPIVDANNRMNGFDPAAINPVSGTPGVVKFAGLNGWRTKPYDTDWNNFGPRFGFAWRVLGSQRFVLRGGYGILFAHPFDHGAPTSASLGFEISAALNTPDQGITAPFYLKDGVPGLNLTKPDLNDSYGAVAVGRNATTAVTYYEPYRRTGYAQHFNLSLQREFPGQIIVELSYLANLSRKLASSNIAINQIRPEVLGPGRTTQAYRPFPQFSNVSINLPAFGVSSYHGGVVRFEKRFSKGLNIVSTYTWSKFLNNVDEGGSALGNEGGNYSNYYNRRADWGPSENDIPHRFSLGSVWELPFGAGRPYLASHPLRHLVGDWGVSLGMVIQSGPAFTVGTQVNTTNSFSSGALRADVLRNPNLPGGQRTLGRWFDTDAFRQPEIYRFGNQGMNLLRGDGVMNVSFSVLRDFKITETKRVQFRSEFFNFTNHPTFGIPGRVLGGPGFGIVSGAQPARVVQLGLRMTF
ncbi:MAG: carboxypeptidase regulatory-like domain-containing protein [Bryobacteraceae bacterium]